MTKEKEKEEENREEEKPTKITIKMYKEIHPPSIPHFT